MNQPVRTGTPGTRSVTLARALFLYAVYVVVFAIGGGIGAGIPALLFELFTGDDFSSGDNVYLYAIMFGVTGFIAYRLAQRVAED